MTNWQLNGKPDEIVYLKVFTLKYGVNNIVISFKLLLLNSYNTIYIYSVNIMLSFWRVLKKNAKYVRKQN